MTDRDFDFDFDLNPDQDARQGDPDPATSTLRNGRTGRRENGRNGDGDDTPPLVHEDGPPPRPSNGRRFKPASERGLESIAEPDDGPAGPRRPGEGRQVARAARRRATGRDTYEPSRHAPDPNDDFEAMLERQPQKGAVAKRGAAIRYGLHGLLDDGRERLRGTGARLGALKEHIPTSIPRPTPGRAGGRDGDGNGRPPGPPRLPRRISSRRPRKPKPGRVKKLRLAVIVLGLGVLALVSMVFGMMMAVAGDLPQLESKEQYAQAENSKVYDSQGREMGTLLSNSGRILVESEDISPYIKQATVAIEDQRFYDHSGVDYVGIARAFANDLMPGGSTQGASTITQQFIKNALEAQGTRTYFQKLREAAYAYHLERQWDKDKILTQYLNTIYFGEGAYGIEAAARTYFGWNHPECLAEGADPCSSVLYPEEAAMLAGIISSPSAASPRANPEAALARRNLVVQKMNEQGYLQEDQFQEAISKALPAPSDIERPAPESLSPYFTEWLRQQLVDKYGAGRAFGGGLEVHTTLDLDMQDAAEGAAYNTLAGIAPTASVVVIDNKTGGVKAMVGGNDFVKEPFNLATNGHRQPGSAFKPFTLITAFENGFTPSSTFTSGIRHFTVPNSGGKEEFEVNNYDDTYYGTSDLTTATLHSDNSIFAELGFGPAGLGRKGPQKVAETAHRMGIETNFSKNPAMILGGIDPGVTPLEMAYAFSTIARDGVRVGGPLDTTPGANDSLDDLGPTAMTQVVLPDGTTIDGGKDYKPKEMRAIPASVASSVRNILHLNVLSGTGENAQFGDDEEWGKTGTTENNGDAWFCGGSTNLTACVWVGHSQTNTPMQTEYAGNPVDGGTFPALIWGRIMDACEAIYAAEEEARADDDEDGEDGEDGEESSGSDSSSGDSYVPPSSGSGSSGSGGGGGGGGGSGQSAPAPAPSGGGGGASGTGGVGL